MMTRIILFFLLVAGLAACHDDDTFTSSPSERLSFSTDTVKMDTLFSGIGSATYSFWVFNRAADGIRLSSVRLRQGNQTGFRVNVDGAYLDNSLGAVVNDLEVRKGDSIRVFVELTAVENYQLEPQLVEDDLIFRLQSGVEQQVNLRAYAWDAIKIGNLIVDRDTLIRSEKPLIVYGGIRVDSAVTLTIDRSMLFFHDKAGIDVYGRLLTDSVLMRGDRLDHMFDYLPYDRVSGQWRGVRLFTPSTGNELLNTEIRNAEYGVRCDSANFNSKQMRLYMENCIVHNCKGPGVQVFNAYAGLLGCQITNTLGDCVSVYGGMTVMQSCTVAQFYPFAAERGAALRFSNVYKGNSYPLEAMVCMNSIVTGYDDDVVMGEAGDTVSLFDYHFEHSLLRTPVVEDTVRFRNIIWESPKDSVQGKQHFVLIDEKNLKYDFHLDSLSTAQGMGCY